MRGSCWARLIWVSALLKTGFTLSPHPGRADLGVRPEPQRGGASCSRLPGKAPRLGEFRPCSGCLDLSLHQGTRGLPDGLGGGIQREGEGEENGEQEAGSLQHLRRLGPAIAAEVKDQRYRKPVGMTWAGVGYGHQPPCTPWLPPPQPGVIPGGAECRRYPWLPGKHPESHEGSLQESEDHVAGVVPRRVQDLDAASGERDGGAVRDGFPSPGAGGVCALPQRRTPIHLGLCFCGAPACPPLDGHGVGQDIHLASFVGKRISASEEGIGCSPQSHHCKTVSCY